jgi:hypothetical protein
VRKLLPIFAAIGLAVGGLGTAAALPTIVYAHHTCHQAWIDLWQHSGFNGSGLRVCPSHDIPDLSLYVVNGVNMNNVVSAIQFNEGTVDKHACVYDATNYVPHPLFGMIFDAKVDASKSFGVTDWGNDKASSVRFRTDAQNC